MNHRAEVEIVFNDGESETLKFSDPSIARTYCRNQYKNPNVKTATLKEIKK